jgi:hypothetical protein
MARSGRPKTSKYGIPVYGVDCVDFRSELEKRLDVFVLP